MQRIDILWRDIPSQVLIKRGRERGKYMLSARFQEAIDRAAVVPLTAPGANAIRSISQVSATTDILKVELGIVMIDVSDAHTTIHCKAMRLAASAFKKVAIIGEFRN